MKTQTALIEIEEMAYEEGYEVIAGVDEAGRGPLAGPVVAAACIFPRGLTISGIDDSKKLSVEERQTLYHVLINHPQITYGVGIVDHQKIDELNILRASLEAMAIAVGELSLKPDLLLVDGNQKPPVLIPMRTIIQGDSLSQSIAAASIIAKFIRDQIMLDLHLKWPEYGFDQHKGYATKGHLLAIEKYGPCPIHRKSFEPVKSKFYLDDKQISFLSTDSLDF